MILWGRKAYYGVLCGRAITEDETSMSYPLKSTLNFIFLAPEGLCHQTTSGKLCFPNQGSVSFHGKEIISLI